MGLNVNLSFEIQLIAALVAAACALPGVFLVLRRMALMTDAITHSVLLGIILAFFIVPDTSSPFLIIGAAASGVLTVYLVETLLRTRLVKEDAAIGLVFPALFSIAIVLISRFARNVHIDTDAVLSGEIVFAPLNRAELLGLNLPVGVWMMAAILLLELLLLALFYKELKLATFDAGLAAALGFMPALIHYGLMTMVSVTAVASFEYVGSILVVALMIAPAATAYLLTDKLSHMLLFSVGIAIASAISGYWVSATIFDKSVSISGTIASITGVFFLLTLVFAPQRGLIARQLERRRRRERFAVEMLLVHLSTHESSADAALENSVAHLTDELRWQQSFADAAVRRAAGHGWIERANGHLLLTDDGRQIAQQVTGRVHA